MTDLFPGELRAFGAGLPLFAGDPILSPDDVCRRAEQVTAASRFAPLAPDEIAPPPRGTPGNVVQLTEQRRSAAQTSSPEGTPTMLVNGENIRTLNVGFNASFQKGFGMPKVYWDKVAMEVPSSTLEQEYGWLGLFPQVREWLGDRVIHSLAASSYRIKNRDFELTIAVKRNDVEDDNIGIYKPMFEELGRSVAEFPDTLVFGLMAAGFSTACYDGQYFFDTDHPVIDGNGQLQSKSNFQDGTGPAWYLLDTSRALKPMIFQNRRKFNFVSKDRPEDDNVFSRKEFVYGSDGRANVGYGLWQLAYASKQPLTAENYEAARTAMTTLRGDNDHRLGIVPTTLVVPMELEGAGRRLLNTQLKSQSTTLDAGGGSTITVNGAGSNEWAGSAELVATPYL